VTWLDALRYGRKVRALVELALRILDVARGTSHGVAMASLFDLGPDALLEEAIKQAAKRSGVSVNAKVIRLAVAELALRHELMELHDAAAELRSKIERMQAEGRL